MNKKSIIIVTVILLLVLLVAVIVFFYKQPEKIAEPKGEPVLIIRYYKTDGPNSDGFSRIVADTHYIGMPNIDRSRAQYSKDDRFISYVYGITMESGEKGYKVLIFERGQSIFDQKIVYNGAQRQVLLRGLDYILLFERQQEETQQ